MQDFDSASSQVEQRMQQFRAHYPMGGIVTNVSAIRGENYVVQAVLSVGGIALTSGLAEASTLEGAEAIAQLIALDRFNPSAARVNPLNPGTPPLSPPQTPTQLKPQAPTPHPEVESSTAQEDRSEKDTSEKDASEENPSAEPNASAQPVSGESPELPSEVIPEPPAEVSAEPLADPPVPSSQQPDSAQQPDPLPEMSPDAESKTKKHPEKPRRKPRRKKSASPAKSATESPLVSPAEPTVEPTTDKPTTEAATDAFPEDPASSTPDPEPTPHFVADWSDDLAQIEVELKRLNWDSQQEADYLQRTYGKPSRDYITDYNELTDFLSYLRSLPSHFVPEPYEAPEAEIYIPADYEDGPATVATSSTIPHQPISLPEAEVSSPTSDSNNDFGGLSRNDMMQQTAAECKRLKWTNRQGSNFLKSRYSKPTRKDLTDAELWDFLQYLSSIAPVETSVTEKLPF